MPFPENTGSAPQRPLRDRSVRGALRRIVRFLTKPFRALWFLLRDSGRSRLERTMIALGGAAGLSSLGFGLLLMYLLALVPFTPSRNALREAATRRASVIVDANGNELSRFERAHRKWVSLEEISPHVVAALVSTEDHRFYSHDGIDYRRMLGAVAYTMTGDTQGGSTITMQLARNLYPDRIGKAFGPNRKCKELVTARKIESVFSKDEILELYLNTVPFLYGVRGIEMAARTYYQKSAESLSLTESATLVGMLKATSYYNPVRNPERSRARRNVVIAQMLKHGAVDSASATVASERPVATRFKRPDRPGTSAPHFVDRVEREVVDWARRAGLDLYSDGLVIHSTLDGTLQSYAETAVRRQGDALQRVANVEWSSATESVHSTDIRDYAALDRQSDAFAFFWRANADLETRFIRESAAYKRLVDGGTDPDEAIGQVRVDDATMAAIRSTKSRLEAGFVAIEPQTGNVLAWVGSRDYVSAPFDHVASARRQPGSTFKPIVYATALESGYDADDFVPNEPVEIRIGRSDVWRLANARDGHQYVTLREGLARSYNHVAARLITEVGPRKTARVARRLGITGSELDQVPSLALGTSPVSLLEMASVYATIAAEGVYNEPVVVTRITDQSGAVLFEHKPSPRRAISSETAIALGDMLRDVVDHGTGRRIRYQFNVRADVGAKTGTTQNNMDGWFMMIHPDIAAGAWVGFDDPRVTFRSDFWGEGAHNALFVVGDVFRQGTASGHISTRARLATPPRRQVDPRIATSEPGWWQRQWTRLSDSFSESRSDANNQLDNRDSHRRRNAEDRSNRVDGNDAWAREWRSDNGRDGVTDNADGYREEWSPQRWSQPDSEIRGLTDRLQAYERLKQQIAEGLRADDRIVDAYRRERDRNPELRELERELDIRVRRWLEEADRRLAELEISLD